MQQQIPGAIGNIALGVVAAKSNYYTIIGMVVCCVMLIIFVILHIVRANMVKDGKDKEKTFWSQEWILPTLIVGNVMSVLCMCFLTYLMMNK